MTKMTPNTIASLRRLQDLLIEAVLDLRVPDLSEGEVMTSGPAPYRRLDCDGRALAYLRPRPRKHGVRVDITGLWTAPRASRLRLANAGGAASLLLRGEADIHEAVRFLLATVERTRRTEERQRAREAQDAA